MTSPSSANKFDGGKLPMHLLPPEAEEALATVLGPGAKKYGERNWEQGGLSWDRLYGAMRRHLGPAHLWMSTGGAHGEWIDKDTGVPHIFCAFAELAFAITYVQRGMIEVAAEPSKPEKPAGIDSERAIVRRYRLRDGRPAFAHPLEVTGRDDPNLGCSFCTKQDLFDTVYEEVE